MLLKTFKIEVEGQKSWKKSTKEQNKKVGLKSDACNQSRV